MVKFFRRLIFFIFVAVFLIGAPRLAFHALGYHFNENTSQRLVQSGLIYLSTTPPGASVYVGGRRYREASPALIRDLGSGQYPIRLALKGYYPWARSVPVEAGRATVVGNILLRPRQPEWKKRIEETFDELTVIPETRYFILRRFGKDQGLVVYDRKFQQKHTVVTDGNFLGVTIERVHVAAGSDVVFLECRHDKKKKWLRIKIDGDETKAEWLPEISYDKPQKVLWADHDESYLFFYDGHKVDRLNLDQKTITESFLNAVRGCAIKNRKLFYLSGENFSNIDFLGKTVSPIWRDADHFLGGEASVDLFAYTDQIAAFKNDEGRLVTNHPPRILVQEGIRGLDYDAKNRVALAWSKKHIREIKFEKAELGREASLPRVDQKVLFSGGKDIQHVFHAHENIYYIYQDQSKVFLLELLPFSKPLVYELLEIKKGSEIIYHEETGELFYLDKKTGYLMSFEIVPRWKVLEIPMALIREKEGRLQQA